ncbi:MAG TPA: OmpA family protein [Rhodocyclaceae bacterium]|nr:OmpA family protein [Rhodocyclaceae bacterium]
MSKTRNTMLALAASAILIPGCASLSGSPGKIEGAIDLSAGNGEARAVFDWANERERIRGAFAPPDEIKVIDTEDGKLLLRLPAAKGFAKASAEPEAPLRAMLDRIAIAIEDPPSTEITILGHTDSLGSETFNLQLSIKRAEAVMEYLRKRGLPLTRMNADGHGESEPIADNGDEPGRALNRRVEIIVKPMD